MSVSLILLWISTPWLIKFSSRYAVVIDVLFGGESANTAPQGTLSASSPPYSYSLLGSANVKAAVTKEAGQTLGF